MLYAGVEYCTQFLPDSGMIRTMSWSIEYTGTRERVAELVEADKSDIPQGVRQLILAEVMSAPTVRNQGSSYETKLGVYLKSWGHYDSTQRGLNIELRTVPI